MKKLTVFFILLLSFSFAEMSAQTIRWEVSGYATLQIRVNGVNQFPSPQSNTSGILNVAAGALVEYIGASTVGNFPLEPISSEDGPEMIEMAQYNDYYFSNPEHTYLEESFTMPNEVPWYIRMSS